MTQHWILLRGLARGHGHWADFPHKLKLLNTNIEVELMEIPGNGTLCAEDTPLNSLEVIAKIRERSRLIKNKKKVNICGISLGGMVALKWAEIFPEEIESVVVVNSSLRQLSKFYQRLQVTSYMGLVRSFLAADSKTREELILSFTSNNVDRYKAFLNSFSEFSEEYPLRKINFFRQLVLANNIFIDAELKVPLKIICSKNDRLVNYLCSVELAKAFKAELNVHPTSGHDLPLDDPDWLASRILANQS